MDELLSTSEVAKLLGVSRVAVFQKIKSGEIPAQKVGRNYVIKREDLLLPGEKRVTDQQKAFIDQSVDRVIDEYGETLKLLKDA